MSRVHPVMAGEPERRTRWSSAVAAEVVRDAENSGQNLKDFCHDRGLNYERVRRWRIRLQRKAKPKATRSFVPVEVVTASLRAVSSPSPHADACLELEVSGCVIRTRGEINEAMLVRAVRAAKEAGRC